MTNRELCESLKQLRKEHKVMTQVLRDIEFGTKFAMNFKGKAQCERDTMRRACLHGIRRICKNALERS